MRILICFILFTVSLNLKAQINYGRIEGVVFTSDSSEVVPFAIVTIECGEEFISTKSDIEGKYYFNNLCSGDYNLRVQTALNGSREIHHIMLSSNDILNIDVYTQVIIGGCFGCCPWPNPVIDHFGEESVNTIGRIDIDKVVGTSIIDRAIDRSSDFSTNEHNEMIIRGSREGDVLYIVDGVKTLSRPILPISSVNEVNYYLGGVPAKYGDTTGGVVILETKGYFDLYYAWLAGQK